MNNSAEEAMKIWNSSLRKPSQLLQDLLQHTALAQEMFYHTVIK